MEKKKIITMLCAQCSKKFAQNESPKEAWPFCSKRCKMIDLGQWLSEKYIINEQQPEEAEDSDINHKENDHE